MSKDEDMMLQLAAQLGLSDKGTTEKCNTAGMGRTQRNPEMASAEARAQKYINKSDEEILGEIKRLKDALKKDRKAYEKQIGMIRGMEAMMSGEQKQRLRRILELLDS